MHSPAAMIGRHHNNDRYARSPGLCVRRGPGARWQLNENRLPMLKTFLSPEIRTSQEFQSAVIRLSIWAFMLPMLGIARYVGITISPSANTWCCLLCTWSGTAAS